MKPVVGWRQIAVGVAALAALGTVVSRSTADTSGGTIAFRQFLDSHQSTGAIFTVLADGSGDRQLTHPPKPTLDEWPDWSPDGTKIVFDRLDYRNGSALMTMRADGSALRRIGPHCASNRPGCGRNENWDTASWSPNGKLIAFGRAWGRVKNKINSIQFFDVYVVRPNGSGLRRVTRISAKRPFQEDVRSPVWSPDGRRLVFHVNTSPVGHPRLSHALFIVNVNGTGLRQLTPWRLGGGDKADWSPDGKVIAFRNFRKNPGEAPGSNIFTIRPNGRGLRQLTHFDAKTWTGYPSFSPDGKSLVFGSTGVGGQADLFVMKADGTDITPITRTDVWESAPAWSPNG